MRQARPLTRFARLAVATVMATGITLAASAAPSAADPTCYDVYVHVADPSPGTTICP